MTGRFGVTLASSTSITLALSRFNPAVGDVVEVKGSHAVYVSQPRAVADLVAKAANGVALATR